MKSEFQPRPESKSIKTTIRPSSHYSNPDLASECFKKGKELQTNGTYERATEQYFRALMYDPKYFQAYCNIGSCYRSQGKYLEARSMYLKSIQLKNDDAISHYNLANVLRVIGNYDQSILHYEYVISSAEAGGKDIGTLNVDSLVNLGICYKLTKQYEKAIDYFEKARRIDSNDEAIIFNEGMAYMANLETINPDIFSEVSKEKALKAESLFKQLSSSNPNHEMATLKLYRISSILDKSNSNLNDLVRKLKDLLSNPKSAIKDEINQTLGYVLNLLKEYEKSASHYEQSVNNLKQKPSTKKIQANIYDTDTGFPNVKIATLTEQQVIKWIQQGQQGQINEIKQYISQMEESNLSKHLFEMALELYLSEETPDNLQNAVQIFNKYFYVDKTEMPFEKLSIEAHKIIGKLLSMQNKYKESIKHFEYISSQLKSNQQRSMVHSSLGGDYEALGEKDKALSEYKLALQEEPENYELIYNVGCCLHEAGNLIESNKYFSKFLELIQKDTKLYLPTKNLFIADCLVTMAGAALNTKQEYSIYEKAWNTIQEILPMEQQNAIQFQKEKLLKFYLRWAELIEEKMMKIGDRKSEEYLQAKQTLLKVYMNLLENPNCPDGDALLNNCAILFYQEKLYVNALDNLNQILFPTAISLTSLALTYFNLGEHVMATKAIYSASQKNPKDALIAFNKEVIEWVYGISKEGRLFEQMDNSNDNQVVARWQYGVLLIDSLSKRLQSQKEDSSQEEISRIIANLLSKSDNIAQNLNEINKIKIKFLSDYLKRKTNKKSNLSSDQLLETSLTNHSNIQSSTKSFLQNLSNDKESSEAIIQILLNLFIFTNSDKQPAIRSVMEEFYPRKREVVHLEMDRRVTIPQDQRSKEYIFNGFQDIITNFCLWQCELQDKLVTIIYTIEKHYYHLKYRFPLEIQYHFPRHNQIDQCSTTLNRLISLVYNVFNIKTNIELKSPTLNLMKEEIITQIESNFQTKMRNESFVPITLGEKLTLMTIHANFESREECVKFIKELQKQSSNKKEIEIGKNIEEVSIIISGIATVSCTWAERNSLITTAKTLLNSPLDLHLQSILEIDQNLQLLKQCGAKTIESIQKISFLKY